MPDRPSSAAPSRPLRVLVVDDHDLFRTGIRTLLEEEGFEVADANSGHAALRRLPGFRPDVVLMDVNMPEMNGIEATRRVREHAPHTAVLMLSVSDEDEGVFAALRAGASGYLLKDANLEDIINGVHMAARGQAAIAPCVADSLVSFVRDNGERRRPERPAAPLAFTAREREVLRLIARGCDNRAIADRLYVSPSTVKNHVSRVLDKLGVDNRVQAATYAIRHGLTAEDEPS